MNLKIGGNSVGKIMYGGQEFGNRKLEPGTILYIPDQGSASIKDAHLFNTTKSWSNIDGIKIAEFNDDFSLILYEVDISGDDFKNLDIEKKYNLAGKMVTVSRSTVGGEYRLNASGYSSAYVIAITAL